MDACPAMYREALAQASPPYDRFESEITMRRSLSRFLLLVPLAVGVLSFNFGERHLITNDDTRFPVLARDVLTHGHWLLPALPDGRAHLVKPPLVVWLISLASWPVGSVSVRTAVLPSLLEAIGVVLVTFWIGRRLFDPDVGLAAGLIMVTTLGVYSFAQSPMPDMAQLLAITAAMAAYVTADLGGRRVWLTVFYGLIGVASLTKGAAGLLPLAIVIVFTISTTGLRGLRGLVSVPGLALFGLIAVPWWILAALAQRDRFVNDVVFADQLLFFFRREQWGWRTLAEPFGHAVVIMLPWCVLLPFAVRQALRQVDPEKAQRMRLLLVWLTTVFVIMAASAQQRERYYLPLCPAAALLIAWWYAALRLRRPVLTFAGAWIGLVAVGAVAVTLDTRRFNATTDLAALSALVSQAPAPLYSTDVPELVLSFNLGRPVLISPDYERFAQRARNGQKAYLIISDRMLRSVGDTPCMHHVARGLATRRSFTVLRQDDCDHAVGADP